MSLVDDEARKVLFKWSGTSAEIAERFEAVTKGPLFLVFVVMEKDAKPFAHLERTGNEDEYAGVGKVFWKQDDAEAYMSDVAFASGYKMEQLQVWPVKTGTVIELFKKADKRHKSETYRGVRADLCTRVSGKIKAVEVFWTAETNAIM